MSVTSIQLDLSDGKLHVAVPTSTIIIANSEDPYQIAVIESNTKFPGKLLLPGGRIKLGIQSAPMAAAVESGEEIAVKLTEAQLKLFFLSTRVDRDIREVTIEKFLDGTLRPEWIPAGQKIVTHHTFDAVYLAHVADTPRADGEEGKNALWYDIRNFEKADERSKFILDHYEYLCDYATFLKTGAHPPATKYS